VGAEVILWGIDVTEMSLRMTLMRHALRLGSNSFPSEADLAKSLQTKEPDALVPASLDRACVVATERIGGRTVITLTPRRSASGTQLIFTHGGGYIHPLVQAHWGIIAALIRRSRATVTVPLYGLAPEYTADDAYPFLETVYHQVRDKTDRHPIYLAGDSAGGGLAAGQAIHCRNLSLSPPAGLILFSPWLDVTMATLKISSTTRPRRTAEPVGVVAAGRWWAGGRDPTDPLVSPLYDTLAGLPPTVIYDGGHDVLLADSKRFADKMNHAGGRADLHIYPAGFHAFVGSTWLPESRSVLADASRLIDSR
jgi:epsilon-lactone hydrolase